MTCSFDNGGSNMSLPFACVGDLLQRLYDNQIARNGQKSDSDLVKEWFEKHRKFLIQDQYGVGPLLSTLLPEKRTDRVYGLQGKSLQRLLGSALLLGSSRLKELDRWKEPGSGRDLADCIEAILQTTVRTPSKIYLSFAPCQPESSKLTSSALAKPGIFQSGPSNRQGS